MVYITRFLVASTLFLLSFNAHAAAQKNRSSVVRSADQKPILSHLKLTMISIDSLKKSKNLEMLFCALMQDFLTSMFRGDYLVAPRDINAALKKLDTLARIEGKTVHDLIAKSAYPDFLLMVQDYAAAKHIQEITLKRGFEQEFWDQNFYYGEIGSAHRTNILYYRSVADARICFCYSYDFQKRAIIIEPHPDSSAELCSAHATWFAQQVESYKKNNKDELEIN
jgi:hypothetical protein